MKRLKTEHHGEIKGLNERITDKGIKKIILLDELLQSILPLLLCSLCTFVIEKR